MSDLIYCVNLKNEVSHLKESIIEDAMKTRHLQSYSFEILTDHKDYLYNILIERSRYLLNDFTIKDKNFRLWGFITDDTYYEGDTWHNHLDTSTINAVLYLQTVKGKGIEYEYKGDKKYYEPKDYDLLIFPNFLNHRPLTSNFERRISLNLELKCFESSESIFNA